MFIAMIVSCSQLLNFHVPPATQASSTARYEGVIQVQPTFSNGIPGPRSFPVPENSMGRLHLHGSFGVSRMLAGFILIC